MGSHAKKPDPKDAPPPVAQAPTQASVAESADQVMRDRLKLRNSSGQNAFLATSNRGGASFLGGRA